MSASSTPPDLAIPKLDATLFTTRAGRTWLEHEVLPSYLARSRWFAGKARKPKSFEVTDALPLGGAHLLLVRVSYLEGAAETYLVPVQIAARAAVERLAEELPQAVLFRSAEHTLYDAAHDPAFRAALLAMMRESTSVPGERGDVIGISGALLGEIDSALESRVLKVEQSNSSIVYGDRIFLKLYRKLEEGVNPDAAITRFLSERQHFSHVPPFAGALEFRRPGREPQVLGLALGLVPNDGDAWAFTLRELGKTYAAALAGDEIATSRFIEAYAARARQLGARTGAMHLALAADITDREFAPEPFTSIDQRDLSEAICTSVRRVFDLLRERRSGEHAALIEHLLMVEPAILARAEELQSAAISAAKTRTHGDYHLGQVLSTGDDFVIIDFEGEPLRPLAERQLKRSPLRDVAGMLRSFHYAANSALAELGNDHAALDLLGERWHQAAAKAFLDGWRAATAGSGLAPEDSREFDLLLSAFLLEKAIYEIGYELNNRPAWLPIPARGILALMQSPR